MESKKLGATPHLAPAPAAGGVSDLNVTPLLDVLLVLLLIGLVSIGLSRRSVAVSLPPTAGVSPSYAPVLLELGADGGYRLNNQPIPASQLSDLLASALRVRPAGIVFLRAHPDRSYRDFITAADLVRAAGATTVAIVGPVPGTQAPR